jgi:NADPH2:quinone reductase|tara:strand:+ start:952 stop:1929 length:978 start_codon:yes stop_codon:yes gene_type:complete
MKAWQFESYGPYHEVLKWSDREMPIHKIDTAIVKTCAVSLNFPDLLVCQGLYQVKAPLPAVPGVEGIGIVESAGPSSKFKIGDRVTGFCHGGGTLAEYFEVTNNSAWLVPNFVSDEAGAALSVTYGTSYFGLAHRAHLQVGETLLVLGGAGGVGLAAIQLGKLMGAKVIAAAGSQKKLEVCLNQGADHVINYKSQNLVEEVSRLTNGQRADVIYDPVGGELFEQTKRCLGWDGRLIIIGFAAGTIPTIETNRLLLKNAAIIGLAWGQYMERAPEKVESCQKYLYQLLKIGSINPVIFQNLSFDHALEGMEILESRDMYGKIVLSK